ncbi:MAG: DNA-binding protein [Actinomycetota bacterium]|nr:DNA-binding protein [Actinomycetota bacterium]MDP3630224.1 DNA-binding protein [Actinomycetota bacterium]
MPDTNDTPSDLPAGLASPARRALSRAGYTHLEQLTAIRESDLTRLHGMGAKAIGMLKVALAARAQGFLEDPKR